MNVRRLARLLPLLLTFFCLFTLSPLPTDGQGLDFDIPGGHFYKQANGQGGAGDTGYAITNEGGIPFWREYQRLGGPNVLGYPASHRFSYDGFTVQIMQKVVFQWRPETQSVAFLNVLDILHDRGKDSWLRVHRMTPEPFDTAPDTGLTWERVKQRHWAFLDWNSAIRARYWADSAPLEHFGLPMSYEDMGNAYVVRAQRVVFQQWKENVPWAQAGEITLANGGDLLKEAGIITGPAVVPSLPPTGGSGGGGTPARHDWRAPGFVSAVGGQLYDPDCHPLRSAGINAPNLLYRPGQQETLVWMREHNLRWVRVFLTGHELSPDLAPADEASAAAALNSFLAQVEAFNAQHPRDQAIYVLVSLTDYYPLGVPGDRYAFDHPTFSGSPVLPAPWYRAGVRAFDFDQEHNQGVLYGMPNYEVNYKPWVQQIVPTAANSPALLGWQLGNELKARGSPRNNITSSQAYGWYLAFTQDMVDTIRAADRQHIIVMGAQYIAELVDWEYRPDGPPMAERLPEYRNLVNRMLNACGNYCWNVWGLTIYDFNLYPFDDAKLFAEAGVANIATEHGFTRGTPEEMMQRFGGDRAEAVRNGLDRPWVDLNGQLQPRQWGVRELVDRAPLAALSPWGSPAPVFGAEYDTDATRGITGTPDEGPLWAAWIEVANSLEAANRAAGVSAACQAVTSP